MRSMRGKLWTAMMVLIAFMLILLWLFQIVFLENMYTAMHLNAIKKDVRMLIGIMESRSDDFTDEADALAAKGNLSIEVLNKNGQVLYSTGQSVGQMPMMNAVRHEVFQSAMAGSETSRIITHQRFGTKIMLLSFPIYAKGMTTGVLLVSMPMAPVQETASILKKQLFYISLILLFMALLLSYFLSRGFTRPLLAIKNAAERMAKGDFSARVPTRKKDEIGQLAHTINDMGVQLTKIEALRKELIANVSHELRTPLSLIRGNAEIIRDVTGDVPQKREKQLGIIIGETMRLSRIVDDMLNLSRLQSGFFELNKRPMILDNLVRNVMDTFGDITERTGISLILQGSTSQMVMADGDRIKQVLINLLNNSLNHTPKGGRITLVLEEIPNGVKLSVSDTGSGIPEEDLPHIFDRYYQAVHGEKRTIHGTGLGLAIVKNILEAHHAPYGAESRLNEGTTIWFELARQ